MNYLPGSLLRKLFPQQVHNRLDRPPQDVEVVEVIEPPKPIWEVAEGISGTFYYHLRDVSLPNPLSQPAPCGARVMQTAIPISTWGFVGHLKERWCVVCAAHAGLTTKVDPK